MPFYDIMLLYNTYADYCDEENKHNEQQSDNNFFQMYFNKIHLYCIIFTLYL